MKSLFFAAPLFLGLFVAGCMEPADVTRQVTVKDDFYRGGFSWNSGSGGIEMRWITTETSDGFLEVCGAYISRGTTANQHHYNIMRQYVVTVNGKAALKDFTFFNKVNPRDSLVGAAANCKASASPAPKAGAEIGLTNSAYGKRYKI